jgi:hypothetical protein
MEKKGVTGEFQDKNSEGKEGNHILLKNTN